MKKKISLLPVITIILLGVSSIAGILSMDFTKSYEVSNQYGDTIKMFGSGIYAHDSYLKAPISIGTDFCILLAVVPLFIYTYLRNSRKDDPVSRLQLISMHGVAAYYAASVSLGLSYNRLHLVYIALLACSLFGLFAVLRTLRINDFAFTATKGMKIFLILAGIALIVAWMPDIIPSLISGKSLLNIEVYTTEITYVLDMGIIGPLCLVSLSLMNRKDPLGTILFAILLKLCIIVGIMMIPQTICQLASGYEMTMPVILTKSGSFAVLGAFAYYFNRKLYAKLEFPAA